MDIDGNSAGDLIDQGVPLMVRGDLSDRVIHLTRGDTKDEARSNFVSIINSRRLLAGNKNIRGGYRCVCFSEAPIAVLADMLSREGGSRYAPYGFMVDKAWLFSIGGRPVIYLRYRHVRYEPGNGVDFTWEREWRLQINHIDIDPTAVTIVVPNREVVDAYQQEHWNTQRTNAIMMGGDGGWFVDSFEWHFLVLEDLGLKIS